MEAQIFMELFQRSEAARLLKGRKEERSEEGREGERKKEKGGKKQEKIKREKSKQCGVQVQSS